MPNLSIMPDLCDVLKITVNDLLSGEVVSMKNYSKELENNLIQIVKEKEQTDIPIAAWLRIVLIVIGIIPFAIGIAYAIWIEQTAGYYKCAKCGYRYVSTYSSVLWAAHIGRTRHMRCPKGKKKSWQKKVLREE